MTAKEKLTSNNSKINSINSGLSTIKNKFNSNMVLVNAKSGSANNIPGVEVINGAIISVNDEIDSSITNIIVNTPSTLPRVMIETSNTIDLECDGNTINCGGSNYNIANLDNLTAENIKNGVSIGGVIWYLF